LKSEYILFNSSNNFSEKITDLLKFFNEINGDFNYLINTPKKANFDNIGVVTESNLTMNNCGNQNNNAENNYLPTINENINKIIRDEDKNIYIKKNSIDNYTKLEVEEIIKKEKTKLFYASKIFQTFLNLNKTENHIYNDFCKSVIENPFNYNSESNSDQIGNKKNKKTYFFRLDAIMVHDLSLQIAICTIIGLFLLQIINKNIAYVLLKFICNKFKLTSIDIYCINNIKQILGLKVEILLGVYYGLIENIKSLNFTHTRVVSKKDIEPLNENISSSEYLNTEINNNILQTNLSQSGIKIEKNSTENFFPEKKLFSKKTNKDINSSENPNFKWEEIIKILELENLIFNLKNISERHKTIYQSLDQVRLEDRKKIILNKIIKPLDDSFNLFDEGLFLIQYLSDFIKHNNFQDLLLTEYTNDYRYYLETKDLFFQYLNNKSKKNIVYNNLTDRIYFLHKRNFLGNHIAFKVKEKKLEEKIAEDDNNTGLKKYSSSVGIDHFKENKRINNTIVNFNVNNNQSNKKVDKFKSSIFSKSQASPEKLNNLNKFKNIQIKENCDKKNKIFPNNSSYKKCFYSQMKKNEIKKVNLEKIIEEEKRNELIRKSNSLKMHSIKPIINIKFKQRNNRNEVEKEESLFLTNVKSKFSENSKIANYIEKSSKINNENNLYSKNYDKISDQDSLIKDKNCNSSKLRDDQIQFNQENNIFNLTSYNVKYNILNNNLLNNFEKYNNINAPLASNENIKENEYRLIPKKIFNRTHNNFFQNELFKIRINKNNDFTNEELKSKNDIERDVTDYLKTIKLNLGSKPSTSLDVYSGKNIIDKNILIKEEVLSKDKNEFSKTTGNFLFNKNENKNNRMMNNKVLFSPKRRDQMSQENIISMQDTTERFIKSSNNFFFKNVVLTNNEENLNFCNNRIVSPKIACNKNDFNYDKNIVLTNKSNGMSKNFGDNVNLSKNSENNINKFNNYNQVSNFLSNNNKNYFNQEYIIGIDNKKEEKFKLSGYNDYNFKNTLNSFNLSKDLIQNKITLGRKKLKSYNPRKITLGRENLIKSDPKTIFSNDSQTSNEKEHFLKKKKVVKLF